MSQETIHTPTQAATYTKGEMVTHLAKRANAGIPFRELIKDARYVSNLINMQAEHLVNSSAALVCQAENLLLDVVRAGK